MTMQLYLEYDGTTVDLMDSGRIVLDGFYPRSRAGGPTVSETTDLWVSGSTAADREAAVRAVNQAFEWARRHPEEGGQACRLYWAMDDPGDAWRTVVVDGSVSYDARLDHRWRRGRVRCTLTIEHLPDWEGPEESIPLSNGNGSNQVNGLKIFNCADGSEAAPNVRHNHVDIAAADVGGDLPGRVQLQVTNLDATYRLYDLWCGQNWTDPANAVQLYEAEDATGETPTAAASCSSGAYVDKTITSGSEQTLFTWPISSAALSAAQGQWVHALFRFASSNWEVNTKFRLALLWNSNTFWQSDQVQPDSDRKIIIRDLFSFRLPPMLRGLDGLDGMSLVLTGQQSSGGSQHIYLDFLALVPADGWRYLTHNGYGTVQNARIIDDGIDGLLYRDNGAGSARAGILSATGAPLQLYPGRDQRLYFWMHSYTLDTAPITHQASVKALFRPRRSGL